MSSAYDSLVEREQSVIMHTYGRYPVAIARGEGCRLFDLDGREYLDLLAGIAVSVLGHGRADLAKVMADQAARLTHVSNLFYQKEQVDLAEKLVASCDADKVFFCNSGAEANEAASKLARRYMRKVKNRDAYEIITLEGSFHGRTLATLTATGQRGPIKDGFGPLPSGFVTVPFDDICALRDAVTDKTAAVLVEMVQGEGGIRPLPEQFASDIAALCKEKDILFMADEVQSGMGRTGRMWAHQHYNIVPDVFTTAKALAGGLPMGACLATNEVAKGFGPGSHATTFGGGPVLAAVACRVLDVIREEGLVAKAEALGRYLKDRVLELVAKYPDKIASVRGLGLMFGIELSFPGKEVWQALLDKGFIMNLSHERVLRLLPPLTIEQADLDRFVDALDQVLAEAG